MVDIIDKNTDEFTEQYNAIQKFRKAYEGSVEEERDIATEAFENDIAPQADLEVSSHQRGQDGIFQSILEAPVDIFTGAVQAVGEVVRTVGGPKNIFKIQPADDIASDVIRTFGQFGVPYLGLAGSVSKFTKAKKLFENYPKLKTMFDAAITGLPIDAFAFAPEQGNVFNFLITSLGVAEDSRTGAALRTYLAVDPADSELKARAKNALTGIIGSVMFDLIIKLTGGAIKSGYRAAKHISKGDIQLLNTEVKHADDVFSGGQKVDVEGAPPNTLADQSAAELKEAPLTVEELAYLNIRGADDKTIKEATDELAEEYLEVIDRAEAGLSVEELAYVGSRLPTEDAAIVRSTDKEVADFADHFHSSDPASQEKILEVFRKIVDSEKLDDIDLETMNPFNLTKLNSTIERKQIIAQIGEIIKEKLPRNLDAATRKARREILDQEIDRMIKYYGVDPEQFMKNLRQAAPDVEGRIAYLRAGKVITDLQVQKALKNARDYLVAKTPETFKAFQRQAMSAVDTARSTSGLNTAFGRGLAELKNIADSRDLASQTNVIKSNMIHDVLTSTPELGHKRASINVKLEEIAEVERRSDPERFAKKRKELTEDELSVRNITRLEKELENLKSGVKLKPKRALTDKEIDLKTEIKSLKKKIKTLKKKQKRRPKTEEELVTANVARLKKRLEDLKSGKTPTKSARELTEMEEALKSEIKAVQAEKKLTDILSSNDLQARARLRSLHLSTGAKTRDVLLEIYINGLLSSIKTSVVNWAGNSTATVSNIFERAYAGAVNDAIDGVTLGEAAQLTWSYVSSFPDFWRTFWYASKHGPSTNAIKSDLIKVHHQSVNKELLGLSGNAGKAMDGVGWAVNLPGRMLLSMDEAFKMIHYRAQIDALSYRKARKILGTGADKKSIALKHAEIKNDVLNHKDILDSAKDFSDVSTFTNKLPEIDHYDVDANEIRQVGGLSRTFKKLLDRDQTGILRVFIPFFQTPVNLLSYAGKRTPLLRRFSDRLQRELRSENAAIRQLAEAQVATGNMMWATAMSLAFTGTYTGAPPLDSNLRRQQEEAMGGSFWYSYLTEDGWVSYNRFDPLGIIMAGSANMATFVRNIIDLTGQGNKDGYTAELLEAYNEVFADAVLGTVRLVTDRHYLQGFGNLIDLLTGDSRGFSRQLLAVSSALDPTASFYASFRRNLNKAADPEKQVPLKQADREAQDPLTAGWNTMAIALNETFENSLSLLFGGGGERSAARNHMGETKFYPGTTKSDELHLEIWELGKNALQTGVNPFAPGKRTNSPVMHKLAALGSTLMSPAQWETIDSIKLSPEEHDYVVDIYVELNKAQKLDKWVSSKRFNSLPEGMQLDQLENRLGINKEIAEVRTTSKFSRLTNASLKLTLENIRKDTQKQVPQRSFQNLFNIGQP